MKSLITIMTVIVLSLAVAAFADDVAEMTKRDIGTEIYEASLIKGPVAAAPLFFRIDEIGKDVGTVLYESHLAREAELASKGMSGVAGGGLGAVKPVDENTRIWESYFGRGSDLP